MATHSSALATPPSSAIAIHPGSLGSKSFRHAYGLKYSYMTGSMYKGIASKELVVAMGKAGLMGFLGTGGIELQKVEAAIQFIQAALGEDHSYGMNILGNGDVVESQLVDLYLRYGIRRVEAATYTHLTPSIVRYRLKGLRRGANGEVRTENRIVAKISRPEVAEAFMSPAPADIVNTLLLESRITALEAELGRQVPVANEICVEADSGGHTDQGVAYSIVPSILFLRDAMMSKFRYSSPIYVGAAGGIGTPEAAAASFILGADFIVTGSINQCTVEAGTSESVKDMLQEMNVQDTAYAPAGDMFEVGAKVQVLQKGVFFPGRANKLYELYVNHNSLDEIDAKLLEQIQRRYFKRSFEEVWSETRAYYAGKNPELVKVMESDPKKKMAMIFRWYFVHTARLAMMGSAEQKVDYQIHTGPALGAFNQWVKNTRLQNWRNRHVAEIAELIMCKAAELMESRYSRMLENS